MVPSGKGREVPGSNPGRGFISPPMVKAEGGGHFPGLPQNQAISPGSSLLGLFVCHHPWCT